MKQSNPSRLAAFLLLLITCFATSHAVDIDGITYIISWSYAKVGYKSDGTQYSGDIVIPDEITVDGTTYPVLQLSDDYVFQGCPELTSLTFGKNLYPQGSFDYNYALKSVTFNRTPPRGGLTIAATFRECQALETVVFPEWDSSVTIPNEMFYNCLSLKTLENLSSYSGYTIGDKAFFGCSNLNPLEFIELAKTTLKNSRNRDEATYAFASCNIPSVSIPEGWTSVPDYTFCDCPLTQVTIPTTVTSIGDYAFFPKTGCTYEVPALHEGLVSIGNYAFSTSIENLSIPSSLAKMGLWAFSRRLKSVTVAEGNKIFEVKDNALYENVLDTDGNVTGRILRNVIAGNGYTGPSVWKDDESVTGIYDFAFQNIPVTGYAIPNLKSVGNGAFYGSAVEKVTIKKDVTYGYMAFRNCEQLDEVTIEEGVKSLPQSIFANCKNLKSCPTLPKSLTSLNKGNEFYNCGFSHVILHSGIMSINSFTFSRNVTDVECMGILPPSIDGYYGYEQTSGLYLPEVTLTVPQGSLELYKQHEAWGQCKEIIGNPDWQGFGSVTSLPGGLWFAQKDGNICYLNNGFHDTGVSAGEHPFQMQIHGDALYVADAGKSHYYSLTGDDHGTGDGMLYKVECTGDSFFKVPMLIPEGEGSDFGDPYTCFIDNSNGDIYTANRSYGVYKFNIADKDWYAERLRTHYNAYYNDGDGINDVNHFVKHQWLDYYNAGIAYSAQIRGFQRDSNGVNWMLCDFNGNGIYRFRDSDIHKDGNINQSKRPFGIVFSGSTLSSIYIDEANGYLYVFSRMPSQYGLYRIALSDISDTDNIDWYACKNLELIDAAPASPENTTAAEGVYVRQITGDSKYIYWSYIAEEGSGHKSGIKMIPATGTPTITYLIEGIEAYGLAVKDFDPSGVEQVADDMTAPKLVNVAGNRISAVEDVTVTVYSTGGTVEAVLDIAEGETVLLDNLNRGIHIIRATAADGTTATLKTVL